jgi:DNA-binding protein HU-beta
MHKSELVAQVAEKTGQSTKVVAAVVDAVFESISDTVAAGGQVNVVGFGAFSRTSRAARTGRNPNSGEALVIPASTAPKFTAGSAFKAKVKNGKAV